MSPLRLPTAADYDREYRRRREAGRPGWTLPRDLAGDARLLDELSASGLLPAGGRALELGCGAGNVCLMLAERGFRVHGVDLSAEAVAWANENAADARVDAAFAVGDVTDPACLAEPGSFDLVIDGHCLHFLFGADRARMLAVAAAALRPDGRLLVRSMVSDTVTRVLGEGWRPETWTMARGDVAMAHIPPARRVIEEVVAAGFAVEHARVLPARDEDDLDEGVVVARRPR